MRKAVEILLSIEQKINTLIGYVTNIDNNLKILLKRSSSEPQQEVKVTASSSAPTAEVMVQQQILYEDDQRPAVLVDVRAFSTVTNSLEKKTLSGSDGKWSMQLKPGKYKIVLAKGPSAGGKSGFVKEQVIEVKAGKPMPLDKILV